MKKSESTESLNEISDLVEKKEDTANEENLTKEQEKEEEEIKENKIQQQEFSLTSPETPRKLKSRSRLSSAFRSLRVTKSNKKKTADAAVSEELTSLEAVDVEKLSSGKKKKSKLTHKFSLSGIKKYRGNPKKGENLTTSSTQTSNTLKRNTTTPSTFNNNNNNNNNGDVGSGANLTLSQISLIDLPDDDDDEEEEDNDNEETDNEKELEISRAVGFSQSTTVHNYRRENSNISNKKENYKGNNNNNINNNNNSKETSPIKFEKVRKIQITIQGKKIERHDKFNKNRNLPITTTSIDTDDYVTALTSLPQQTENQIENNIGNNNKNNDNSNNDKKSIIENQSKSIKTATTKSTIGAKPQGSNINSNNNNINNSNSSSSGKRSNRKKTKTQVIKKKTEKPQEEGKLQITESILDTPPLERAPPRPSTSSEVKVSRTELSEQNNISKGAIRKLSLSPKLKRQSSISGSPDRNPYMRSFSTERGRRYPRGPRPSDDSELDNFPININSDFSQSPTKGNNVLNPNLSGSIASAVETTEDSITEGTLQEDTVRERILQFSIGSAVRPFSQQSTASDTRDLSSLESSGKSSPRSQSPISESSVVRRKIHYISQPTLFGEEEKDSVRKEQLSLSYISEYSFESYEPQMPAFGDLTMDHEEVPIMTTAAGEKREYLYKILVIGELGTGKTSFIKRYVHQFFSQNYRATIGVDFALKVLHWDQNTIIRLQLWDIAGQERFGNMTRVYYKEAVGAFIVFDVTRSGTFDCVTKWKEDLDSKIQLPDGSSIPCILLANKCDQEKQGIITNPEKMDEFVRDHNFAGWFETSAKENVNIDEAAKALVNKILLNDKLISAADLLDNERFQLPDENGAGSSDKRSNCSC